MTRQQQQLQRCKLEQRRQQQEERYGSRSSSNSHRRSSNSSKRTRLVGLDQDGGGAEAWDGQWRSHRLANVQEVAEEAAQVHVLDAQVGLGSHARRELRQALLDAQPLQAPHLPSPKRNELPRSIK